METSVNYLIEMEQSVNYRIEMETSVNYLSINWIQHAMFDHW